jgi:hypothetical protein
VLGVADLCHEAHSGFWPQPVFFAWEKPGSGFSSNGGHLGSLDVCTGVEGVGQLVSGVKEIQNDHLGLAVYGF